jgi:rSAM/selenodomain-associated transferase 2
VPAGLSISVVIATLNEQGVIERALASTQGEDVERIVVDGGSVDGTCETARFLGAERVLSSLPGRAHQMDAGYRAASGDVIVFLHADTRLDPEWSRAIQDVLSDSAVAGGAFRLRFDSVRWIYRFIEFGARLRTRLGGLPYGDQALFLRRKLLEESDGIAIVPIFEDLDLAGRIRARGGLALLREPAWTSPRRYEANGVLRTWLRNTLALGAYLLRADRNRVARWYRRRPER